MFMKRLRRSVNGRIRFVGCGEYGDESGRPHYHLCLFGFMPSKHVVGKDWRACCCEVCKAWGKGGVSVGFVSDASAAYTVSYVMKGMTKVDDERLKGRTPEFARFSLRPGIGAGAAEVIAAALVDGAGTLRCGGDVPNTVRIGAKLPLGRYIRRKVAERVGVKSVLEGVRELRALESQSLLSDLSEREKLSGKRVQDARSAEFKFRFIREKKGRL